MLDLREQAADLLRSTFGTITTMLCIPETILDDDLIDDLAAEVADEWGMWLSAGAVMPDWTYAITEES